MTHDNLALQQALPPMSPPAIATALRKGTAIIPTSVAPEGDERFVVVVDDEGRRIILVFSTRQALRTWGDASAQSGRYRVVRGSDLGDIAREQHVGRVVLDPGGVGLGVAPVDLQQALDQAEADGVPALAPDQRLQPEPSISLADGVLGVDHLDPAFDNPELTEALRSRDHATIAAALRSGTVILTDSVLPGGEHRVDVFAQGDGRTNLSGFSSGALFTDWVRRSGHEGGYRVIGGVGLAELIGIIGVDAFMVDEGVEHSAAFDAASLARYLV